MCGDTASAREKAGAGMRRVYSYLTGQFLGLIWFDHEDKCWCSEGRNGITLEHDSEEDAMARLERQPAHRALRTMAADERTGVRI